MQWKTEKDQRKGDRECWKKEMGEWGGDSFKGGGQGKPTEKRDWSKDMKEGRRVLHSTDIYLPGLLYLAFKSLHYQPCQNHSTIFLSMNLPVLTS